MEEPILAQPRALTVVMNVEVVQKQMVPLVVRKVKSGLVLVGKKKNVTPMVRITRPAVPTVVSLPLIGAEKSARTRINLVL